MPSDRKQVVVLYAETKLQKSIDLPGSSTVARAKEEGMIAIKDHLNLLPGVPHVSLDPECTDFYPAPKNDNTMIRSLEGNLTMVVYPEPPKGQRLTPSPFVDALQSASHEVRDLKAQKNATSLIGEECPKRNVKPVSIDALLRRLEAMEERFGQDIAELKRDNAELKRDNAELKRDIAELKRGNAELKWGNAELKRDNAELSDRIDETMRAVLGDEVAIDKIRWRVFLDMGRDQLAVICGHENWREWKEKKATSTPSDDFAVRTAMMTEVETILRDSNDPSEYWKAVGQDRSTLRLLIHRNHIRTYADIAAHSSTEQHIAESVLALAAPSDRTHMTAIFCAVFNKEP
jgi:FtsZ-binding cell division protein ZapB